MNLPRHRARRRRGFTLIELLVAITVLSVVSLISWRGLESLTATRARLEPEGEEIRAMLVVFGQMELDVEKAADPYFLALPFEPISAGTGGAVMEIVRFAPVDADQPSMLQRVVYTLSDGRLVRQVSTPVSSLGLLPQAPLSDAPLLSGIRTVQLRVWRRDQGWVDAAAGLASVGNALPEGLEVTLERNDGTRLRRVLTTR